jgi:hypothetical protein
MQRVIPFRQGQALGYRNHIIVKDERRHITPIAHVRVAE